MIRYRSFRNSDPPALAEIWRTQPPERGLMQPMSADLLEHEVLSKPYFDQQGLIVALDHDEPVGFAHAAFGPNRGESGLSTEQGVTCLVMVRANYQRQGIGAELLRRSEEYLRSRGARELYAGGTEVLNAFYLGLYGGSELPGVLDSAPRAKRLFAAQGYVAADRMLVLHRELAGFRAQVDRQQIQLRRKTSVRITPDPTARTWWEACTLGGLERTRYELLSRDGGQTLASATFWTMQPIAASWGVRAAGVLDVTVDPNQTRTGLATCLLGEGFRALQQQAISLVEVQVSERNIPAVSLWHKLGFNAVDQGTIFRKPVAT